MALALDSHSQGSSLSLHHSIKPSSDVEPGPVTSHQHRQPQNRSLPSPYFELPSSFPGLPPGQDTVVAQPNPNTGQNRVRFMKKGDVRRRRRQTGLCMWRI